MAEQAASCDRSSNGEAKVLDNAHPKEIEIIIGILEELKAKSKGQYYENIIEKCHTEHGWTECKAASVIESAIKNEAIYDVVYRGKKAFRIKERNTVMIRDMNGSDSTSKQQNDLSFQTVYHDFKQHVWDSLADLNSALRNLSSEMNSINSKFSPIQSQSTGKTPDRSIISVLEARISSLERQLDEKQRVIELLIGSGPKQQANPTQANSNNNTKKSSQLSSNLETQNKQKRINTAASSHLGTDSTALGKKTKNKKKKTANNNNGEEVQRPQGNKTLPEQSQEREENLSTNNLNGNSDERKKITIIGDSMLNGIVDRGLSNREHKVWVKNHPGANTEDILDHLKPTLRRKPELVIIHSRTNDITDNKDTILFLDKAIELVQKDSPNTEVAISLPIMRKDKEGRYSKKLRDLKRKIQKHCTDKDIALIDNDNITQDGLGIKGLHLNRKGNSQLARNLKDFIDSH